ncbi:hypothetical protein JMJ77_0013481, partial [Colletotrichum scovillei]
THQLYLESPKVINSHFSHLPLSTKEFSKPFQSRLAAMEPWHGPIGPPTPGCAINYLQSRSPTHSGSRLSHSPPRGLADGIFPTTLR